MPCDPSDPFVRYLTDPGTPNLELIAELGPDEIRERLRECPDLAFTVLWDEERARRLAQTGPKREYAAPLLASIDHVLALRGMGLDPLTANAAWLMAASLHAQDGVLRDWPRIDGLQPAARRTAVSGMQSGRFDEARAIDPSRLLGLLLNPAASQRRAAGDPLPARAAEAVRAAMAQAGAAQLFGKINACMLHATALLSEDDRIVRRDLLAASGHGEDSLARLVAAARGEGAIESLRLRGHGMPRVDALLADAGFKRAAEWLGVQADFDPEVIAMAAQLGELASQHPDPWVRWACGQASSGEAIDPMFDALRPLGTAGIRDRSAVLSAVIRAGLLTPDSVRVLESEIEGCGDLRGKANEVAAFRVLFERRTRHRDPSLLPFRLRDWYQAAESAYVRGATELASLPQVNAILVEAAKSEEVGPEIAELVRQIQAENDAAVDREARRQGRLWLVRLIRHCAAHEGDTRHWDAGARILTDEDITDLRSLVRSSRDPVASSWFTAKLQGTSEFRFAEAAFRLRMLGDDDARTEEDFKRRINGHYRLVRDAPGLSQAERDELKELCERCGRHILGGSRIADSQPRGATLEAFRRGDARGMLRGEMRDGDPLGLPYRAVPTAFVSRTALIAWGAAAVLLLVLLGILFLGGEALPSPGAMANG